MFPENPFLQLALPRVSRALQRVQSMIWTEIAPVACSFVGAQADPVSWERAKKRDYQKIKLPFHWGKLFDQGWFRLELPKVKAKGSLYLHWNDQGEGTAYIDGIPFYGFDVAHRYCPLPDKVSVIYMESLCLQSAIWHPAATGIDSEGSKLGKAALYTRDDLAWEVWHDLQTLFEIAIEEGKSNHPTVPTKVYGVGYQMPVESVTPIYRRLLRALDGAANAFDQGGLPAMRKCLKEIYKSMNGQADRIRAVLTGHAHIDLVWLWPERTGEYKATHTFSTMNRLMDLYPDFIFGYSQPTSYDAVKRISPQLMDRVQKRIASGRWEVLGATEVESDTLLPCGEGLARSFLVGQKGFQRLQGKPSRVLWIPDVFGYCGCLPQIMRQTGVEYFFTTKLTWSNINHFPYSSFIWKGIDGSEVLTHVTHENGYEQRATPLEIKRGARAYRQSDVHDEYLSPTGYGDGGGGATEEMCERAQRLKSLAGMPTVGWGRVDDFFDKLNEQRAKLPTWQGELYLEYHRGVLTTHSDLKARFREGERSLQIWEAARCALGGGELDDQYWRKLIFAQFHDYIPGSSIWEVYEEGLPELSGLSTHALTTAKKELGDGGAQALFNPLPIERIHVIEEESRAVRLAPLSGAPLPGLPAVTPVQAVHATTKKLQSHQVTAAFDAKGRIASLAFGGNKIALSAPMADLILYPDFPHEFEAWDIDRQTLSLGRALDTPAKASMRKVSSLQAEIEFRRQISEKSSIAIRYRLDAFQPVLHIEYDVDWHEEMALLKVLFPTSYAGRTARFGAPYGSVQRSQQAGGERDEALFEGAASRWAIVADDCDTEGLGVVTEAKYGFSCRDGVLGVSLLRSPRVTGEDPKYAQLFPNEIRRGGSRVAFADQGRHVIRLALCFHSPGTTRENLAPTLADTLFTQPLTYQGEVVSAGLIGIDGLESVVPCWAKPAADGNGWILRLHETMGRRGAITIRLRDDLKAYSTDLSEAKKTGKPSQKITVSPYELISLRIC